MRNENPTYEELIKENQKLKTQLTYLQEKEKNYEITLNSIGDAVMTIDVNGFIKFMNPIAERLTGWSETKAEDKKLTEVFQIINAQTRKTVHSPVSKVLESGNIEWLAKNTLLISNDGTECQIGDSASPIRDKEGNITGVVLVFRDVSEYYRISKELETSEEELRASNEELQKRNETLEKQEDDLEIYKRMIESTKDMMAVVDADYNYICVNNTYLKYYQLKHEEIIGHKAREVIGEKHFEKTVKPNLDKCLKGEAVQYEMIREFPEIGKVNLDIIYYPLKKDERIEGVVSSIRDVTRKKKSEEALKNSEQQFRQLFEQAAIGIFIADVNHNIVDVNEKALSILGYSREEIVNLNAKNIIYPDDFKRLPPQENLKRMRSGEILQVERRFARKDGDYIEVLVNMGIFGSKEDSDLHMIMFQDITERKQAEEELQIKNQISNSFIQSDDKDFYKEVLDIIKEVFSSEYGYFGYINKDGDLVAESMTRDVWDECQVEEKSIVSPRESWAGLWGDSLKERKTLYKNGNLQLPEGHVQLTSAMAAPIIANEQLVGQIALANKAGGYDYKDKKLIRRLSDYIAPLLHSKLKEDQYKKDLLETKEKVEATANKFHTLVEQSAEMLFLHDLEGQIIEVNRAAEKNIGYSREELYSMNIWDIHPDAVDIKNWKALSENDPPVAFETRHQRKDGTIYPAEVVISQIVLENNEYILGIARDITERKQAEDKLVYQKNLLEGIINGIPDILAIQYPDHTIERYNQAGYDILNMRPEDVRGKKCYELIGRDNECEHCATRKALQSGNQAEVEKYIRELDGYYNCRSVPIENDDGKVVRIVEQLRDITRQKQDEQELIKAKEQAEESERLKSAFLANMSHEIRTPMNGIMGFSEMLLEKEFSKEKRDKFLNIIYTRSNHLLNIINDLVDVSKIEANQLILNHQNFCLNDVLKEIYRVYNNELKVKGKTHVQLKFNKSLDSQNSYIWSDSSRFRQIMDNLLTNAIKFTHEGIIEFGYELKSDDQLLFYVKDTGIGIPYDQQEHIFERFRQADDTANRAYEGTGLGLTISKNLVELLGGEMWMTSEEGEGSIFYFTLPYERKPAKKEQKKKEDQVTNEGQGKTLLIIEDDPTSLEYMKELLESNGFKMILSETGEEGYEAFLNNPEIDLILMDIKLPDTNGLELTQKIRSLSTNKDVPIIAQTAYAMSEDAQKSLDAGCDDYISKPVDIQTLLSKLNKLL